MPRKVLIFSLLLALTLLITLMGWFSVRLYKMEQSNADNLLLREHENTLSLTLWELETRALSLYNNCIAELSIPPSERQYVKRVCPISTSPDLSGDPLPLLTPTDKARVLEMCINVHKTAVNTTYPEKEIPRAPPPLPHEEGLQSERSLLQEEESVYSRKLDKAWSYDNRKGTVNEQKIAAGNIAYNSQKKSPLRPPEEVINTASSRSDPSELENSDPLTTEDNKHPFQAGWVEDQLYLFRKGLQEGTLETVLLDHTLIFKKLMESQPDISLTASDRPFISMIEGSLTLIPPETIPYAENTLITLPYQLILPLPVKPKMNLNWIKTLAITWVALLLTILLAALFIFNLIRLSQRRSEFVSSVTHELRTPLTSFQLYAEMLRDDLVPSAEKRTQYLDTLSTEASRLSHLVENVLTYSQIERGKVRKSTVLLSDLLPPILDRLRSRVDQSTATLRLENPLPLETQIMTDPTAVEQILFNLVDNACKYALEENPSQELRLSVSATESALTFSLSDDGPGISKKERRKLFQPFHKSAEKAADTAKPGVGLGLSIAKRQAKLLGGTLTLEPSERAGCTFLLTVPCSGCSEVL